ncbi:hypothetical protein [Leptospira ellisii]|nr:hypothetical protein [Leptospira ellisii]
MSSEDREGMKGTILALVAPEKVVDVNTINRSNEVQIVQSLKTSENTRRQFVNSEKNVPLADCVTTCQSFDLLLCPPTGKPLLCEVTVFPEDGGPMETKHPPAQCFPGETFIDALRYAKAFYHRMFCFGDGGKVP